MIANLERFHMDHKAHIPFVLADGPHVAAALEPLARARLVQCVAATADMFEQQLAGVDAGRPVLHACLCEALTPDVDPGLACWPDTVLCSHDGSVRLQPTWPAPDVAAPATCCAHPTSLGSPERRTLLAATCPADLADPACHAFALACAGRAPWGLVRGVHIGHADRSRWWRRTGANRRTQADALHHMMEVVGAAAGSWRRDSARVAPPKGTST